MSGGRGWRECVDICAGYILFLAAIVNALRFRTNVIPVFTPHFFQMLLLELLVNNPKSLLILSLNASASAYTILPTYRNKITFRIQVLNRRLTNNYSQSGKYFLSLTIIGPAK